jgi:hypothetical protein
MAKFPRRLSNSCRQVLALAAALAMFPPLYAGTNSCESDANCSLCSAWAPHHDASNIPNGGCCHVKNRTAADTVSQRTTAGNDLSCCACSPLPPSQKSLPASRTVSNPQGFVALWSATFVVAVFPEPANFSNTVWLASLNSAVPHRILHCTWLI